MTSAFFRPLVSKGGLHQCILRGVATAAYMSVVLKFKEFHVFGKCVVVPCLLELKHFRRKTVQALCSVSRLETWEVFSRYIIVCVSMHVCVSVWSHEGLVCEWQFPLSQVAS